MSNLIFGCGDIGRRIAQYLIQSGCPTHEIHGYVNSQESNERAEALGVTSQRVNLDSLDSELCECDQAYLYYTVAPQNQGVCDERSRCVITKFIDQDIKPKKVVLISTTGVYEGSDGEWLSELSVVKPQTDRGLRRLDAENQWLTWARNEGVSVIVLRVPSIYAYSRLPRERIKKRTPVVKAAECGFSNRIHADDLAQICVIAMQRAHSGSIYNTTDGVPGTITEYLQAAAKVLGYAALPEISMVEAKHHLSSTMLSYLSDSRKVSHQKMIDELQIKLRHVDFRKGLLV